MMQAPRPSANHQSPSRMKSSPRFSTAVASRGPGGGARGHTFGPGLLADGAAAAAREGAGVSSKEGASPGAAAAGGDRRAGPLRDERLRIPWWIHWNGEKHPPVRTHRCECARTRQKIHTGTRTKMHTGTTLCANQPHRPPSQQRRTGYSKYDRRSAGPRWGWGRPSGRTGGGCRHRPAPGGGGQDAFPWALGGEVGDLPPPSTHPLALPLPHHHSQPPSPHRSGGAGGGDGGGADPPGGGMVERIGRADGRTRAGGRHGTPRPEGGRGPREPRAGASPWGGGPWGRGRAVH